ncbi:hypothetical protein KAR10_08840 [bacterium]|nr:hypothetical protein [bacterium]
MNIKIRAWNAGRKKMFSAEEMVKDQMTLLPTGNFINVHSNPKHSHIYSHDKMLPLLFTGLKDKNGKEVWERDIAKGEDGKIYLVDFRYGGWVCVHAPTCGTEREGECLWDDLYSAIKAYNLVIIGNELENPELLKGNNMNLIEAWQAAKNKQGLKRGCCKTIEKNIVEGFHSFLKRVGQLAYKENGAQQIEEYLLADDWEIVKEKKKVVIENVYAYKEGYFLDVNAVKISKRFPEETLLKVTIEWEE